MHKKENFWKEHSLTFAVGAVLLSWVLLYFSSNENSHWGTFFGNAIADWTGLLTMILATKYLYEKGSEESKNPGPEKQGKAGFFMEHSLTLFLILTGTAWIVLYRAIDPRSKWGEVVGNIVSEWTQILALVLFTKRLIERGSKESKG